LKNTIRDGQSYDELLKEVNKGMNEYKQFRNLYDDIPDIVANNNPKPKSKPKPSSSNRSPLWQFELQEAILDRGVRF
jgi:hypothetical protein